MDLNTSPRQSSFAHVAHARADIECTGRGLRFPQLLCGELPTAVPAICRHSVRTVVIEGRDLDERTNRDLATAWFANYSGRNYVSCDWLVGWRDRLPELADEAARSLHLVAMDASTGKLLCYMAIKPDQAPTVSHALFGQSERPQLPVEQLFGAGIFGQVAELRSLSAHRVREVGRFVKDQLHSGYRDLKLRAPIEIKCAFVRMFSHYLACDALVGDSCPNGAVAAFDLFHCPYVLVTGHAPRFDASDLLSPYFETAPVLPFGLLRHDVQAAQPRSRMIEAMLDRPDLTRRDLVALHWEARDCSRRVAA